MDGAVLTWLQGADGEGRLGQELDDEDLGAVLGETDTDVRVLGIRQDFHLSLHLKKQTMGVHVLRHLGEVTSCVVIVEVRVTNDGLLLGDELEVLADLLEVLLVGVVPGALLQQVLGVLVGGRVCRRVEVDLRPAKASSEVIDRLHDLSTDLAHLVKRWQVGILRVLIEVERVFIAFLLRL